MSDDTADRAASEGAVPAPLVMLVRAVCLKCGEEPRGINGPNGEDWRFPALVPASWLHDIGARRPHSFLCDGQVQLESQPHAGDPPERPPA